MSTFTYPSHDGVHQIHATLWQPEGTPRAVIQIVHGLSDHIMRYETFAKAMVAEGFVVAGHDQLGHGRTAVTKEDRGFFSPKDGWRNVVADVHQLRLQMAQQFPGLPHFLLGHSMGSFVARNYLFTHPGQITGCLLSGTGHTPATVLLPGQALCGIICALQNPNRINKLTLALALGPFNKQFNPARTPVDWISRDEAIVDAYLADPYCHYLPSAGMVADMVGGMYQNTKSANLKKMDKTTPIHFFSGDHDPVGHNGKDVTYLCQQFKDIGCQDVTATLYKEGRHEMLNETNRQDVYRDISSWLTAHLPA